MDPRGELEQLAARARANGLTQIDTFCAAQPRLRINAVWRVALSLVMIVCFARAASAQQFNEHGYRYLVLNFAPSRPCAVHRHGMRRRDGRGRDRLAAGCAPIAIILLHTR